MLPQRWNLTRYLYAEFARRTSKHLSQGLDDVCHSPLARDQQAHVALLMKAMKSGLKFESDMATKLEAVDSIALADSGAPVDIPTIADAFDPFLAPYVMIEKRNMDELILRLLTEDEVPPVGEDGTKVQSHAGEPFASCLKLFEFVKASVKRCTAFSTGRTLLALALEQRAGIQQYIRSLHERCPQPVTNRLGKPPSYVVSTQEEMDLCRIINTAEYCAEVRLYVRMNI